MKRFYRHIGLMVSALMVGVGMQAFAADQSAQKNRPAPEAAVDMFKAIEAGQIEVQLIPKDSTECRVIVKNKTDKPLTVGLPQAFAGVPVLAQLGLGGLGGELGGYGGGGYGGGGYGGRGGQGFGGGFGGMGGYGGGGYGGYGGGGFGGFMNVPPEKITQVKVPVVCLDHGKPDPTPQMKYEIRPIEDYAKKPEVAEILKLMAAGKIPQRVAQAAAWHLNNDMSFQELAAKEIRSAIGLRRPYFSPIELQAAMQAVMVANRMVLERQKTEPAGKSDSLSSN